MAGVKLFKYASGTDFDASINKESKAPVRIDGHDLIPLITSKAISSVGWLGANGQEPYLFNLMLGDGSSLLVRQGSDGAPQVIYRPPYK